MKQFKKMALGMTLAFCVMGLAACGTSKKDNNTTKTTENTKVTESTKTTESTGSAETNRTTEGTIQLRKIQRTRMVLRRR